MSESPNLGAVRIGPGGPTGSRLADRIERDLAKQLNHDALQHELYHRDFYDRALGRFVG